MIRLGLGFLAVSALVLPLVGCGDPSTVSGATDETSGSATFGTVTAGIESTAVDGTASATGDGSASQDGGSSSVDGPASAEDGSASADGPASADGSASADGGPVVGEPCASDEDCPIGICDESSGFCVGCLEGANCCVDDGDCPIRSVCDEVDNVCVECVVDTDCPQGWTCDAAHVCQPQCTTDLDCQADEICTDAGVCQELPGGECIDSTDCDPSLGCGAGYCLRCQGNGGFCNTCAETADCAPVYVCNVELASCVECLSDAECNGDICHPYGECGPLCAIDADCPQGRLCDEFGRCIPPPGGSNCNDDDECPGDMQCVVGLCKACVIPTGESSCQPCQPGQPDCADGTQCDNDVFVCVECRNDADCSGGEACQFGGCVAV